MKHLFLLCLLLTTNCLESSSSKKHTQQKSVRGCIGWGFFAEFLWVINHLNWCEKTHQTPVVYWGSSSSYYSPNGYNGSTNAWEYYFEPVSTRKYKKGNKLRTDIFYSNFSAIWNYPQYIENIDSLCSPEEKKSFKAISNKPVTSNHSYPVGKEHLYNPKFRKRIKESYIDKYIKIKRPIAQKINNFYTKNMKDKRTIGIHLRGKFIANEVDYIPTNILLAQANKFADGNTQFFIATDQYPLLEEAIKTLQGKVIYYQLERSTVTTSPIAGGAKLHPQDGEDILIETILLSKCNHLIHTLSNVSTTALYFNPSLSHTVLY